LLWILVTVANYLDLIWYFVSGAFSVWVWSWPSSQQLHTTCTSACRTRSPHSPC